LALILDTNALSAAADDDPSVAEILSGVEHILIPVIVLGEYRLGISQSRHRNTYEDWLREWVSAATVLDVDEKTASVYASIGLELKTQGKPIPTNDLWIAALCRQYSLALLSRDRHFDLVRGLQRIDW
jgi:tRNA(fMet)-specific endonuclease VapC